MINQDKKIVDGTNIELYDQAPWSRTTVADGNWLQRETLDPISANDRILASAIHDVSATLQDEIDYLGDELYNTSSYLEEEITKINARADVIDVVGNHEAFEERSAHLVPGVDISDRDVIKVLNDVGDDIPAWVLDNGSYVLSSIDTNNQQSYYRWLSAVDGNTSGWEYVGSLEPYYKDIELSENNITFENTAPERNYSIKADINRYIQITPYNHDASIGLSDDFINSANLAFEAYDALSSISGINDGSITGPRVNHLVSNFSLAQGSANSATYYSFSQGLNNSAENDSLAQGANNKANNRGQALGFANSANSDGFAAGQNNSAENNSFAQGNSTKAEMCSFAQGSSVTATSTSLVQGQTSSAYYNSIAQGKNSNAATESFAAGYECSADLQSFAQGKEGYAVTASIAQGIKNKATKYSFAQGTNCSAHDDSLAQGGYVSADERSIAQGYNTSAYHNSFAQGYSAYAYDDSFTQGDYVSANAIAFAQGRDTSAYYNSFAQGKNTNANMEGFAQGTNAQASNQSFAQGYNITATDYAFGQGSGNNAASRSFAQGSKNKATYNSVAIGNSNSADFQSFAVGTDNIGKYEGFSHGNKNESNADSLAQGDSNSADTRSLAQGLNNYAYHYSLAQGQGNNAKTFSLAQGISNSAKSYAAAFGTENDASETSITQGNANTASYQSIAIGNKNSAYLGSVAIGSTNVASTYSQAFGKGIVITNTAMSIGSYNKTSADIAFVIGNGTDDSNRSDLFWINKNGDVYTEGDISASNFYINGSPIDSIVSAKFSAYNDSTKIAELPISAFKLQANTAKYISATTAANTMIFNVSDALINSASSGFAASAWVKANGTNLLNSAYSGAAASAYIENSGVGTRICGEDIQGLYQYGYVLIDSNNAIYSFQAPDETRTMLGYIVPIPKNTDENKLLKVESSVPTWSKFDAISSVNHDDTLTGDGTSTAALGVVDNLKFSTTLSNVDLSRASATISPVKLISPTMEYMRLQIVNAMGNTGNYTLIPSNITSGYLYANGAGPITTKSINSSQVWCYAFTTANNSLTTTKSADYLEIHLTTPYDYNGPETYTATIDNQVFRLYSGAYCKLIYQWVESHNKWCVADSGYYDI